MARLLNLACFILQRSQVFSRLDIEKDLSADALVAGLTCSLQIVTTSPMRKSSAGLKFVTLFKMSSKHKGFSPNNNFKRGS